jgi:hypothetical protein
MTIKFVITKKIMAAKQSMKPRVIAPKTTVKKSIATKPAVAVKASATKAVKTPAAKVAKSPAAKAPRVAKAAVTRATKAPATKTPVARVAKTPSTRVAKTPAIKKGRAAKTSQAEFVSNNLSTLNGNSADQQQDLLGQAIQALTQLREQLAKTLQSSSQSGQNAEIEQLRQENVELREKASLFDQMTSLLPGQPAVAKTVKKTSASVSTPRQTKSAPAAKAPAKAVSPAATRKTRSGGASILQEAAAADVNRTFKSCWPIVFKIEEWNQKHPSQLAKVSQTMLNKSGVNFSRAKGFMDNYGDLVESYHQQIGLSKANSGKFNEVYEFIRAALGKGKKV